jgi:hypothetical protein
MITFNGKPFNEGDFARSLEKAAVQSFIEQVRARFGAIRDPNTGEFPTIFATGETLEELRMHVEATPALMASSRSARLGRTSGQYSLSSATALRGCS